MPQALGARRERLAHVVLAVSRAACRLTPVAARHAHRHRWPRRKTAPERAPVAARGTRSQAGAAHGNRVPQPPRTAQAPGLWAHAEAASEHASVARQTRQRTIDAAAHPSRRDEHPAAPHAACARPRAAPPAQLHSAAARRAGQSRGAVQATKLDYANHNSHHAGRAATATACGSVRARLPGTHACSTPSCGSSSPKIVMVASSVRKWPSRTTRSSGSRD